MGESVPDSLSPSSRMGSVMSGGNWGSEKEWLLEQWLRGGDEEFDGSVNGVG